MPRYPIDLEIRPLRPDEWHLVAETFETVFGNIMPDNPNQCRFYGVFLGEQFIGFTHLEVVYHLNAVYLKPEHRDRDFVKGVFDVMEDAVPAGFPAIILPDKDVGKLLKHYGFRDLGTTQLWRKEC